MFSRAAMRPLAQAMQRQAMTFARPPMASKVVVPSINAQLQSKKENKLNILHAAMPQLIPFYFVNETVTAFIALPTLIYVLSKYILPQNVRLMAARLFISKL